MLFDDETNWGPKLFCMLKCWAEFLGYHDFVRNNWRLFEVEGWGGYVLKNKFKLVKGSLNE